MLGAGFGGLGAAASLSSRAAAAHDITLVDAAPGFHVGFGKLWVLVGERSPETGFGDYAKLRIPGATFIRDTVSRIDPATRRVTLAGGRTLEADRLIVALGAVADPGQVPGLPAANNLYDRAALPGLRDRLAALRSGRIAIVVVKPPYKCPPAPYECAMLVDHFLVGRGVRNAVAITVYIPEALPMTVAGPAVGRQVLEICAARNIRVAVEHKLDRVEADGTTLHFAGRAAESCDLLLAIPPHRVPECCAPLVNASGWIPADPATGATAFPGVFAIGDVAGIPLPGGGMLPKAGFFAQAQGEAAAEAILAEAEGRPAAAGFDGTGICWFEAGGRVAMRVRGAFYGDPTQRVQLDPPTSEAFAAKQASERERLAAWFGS